MELGKLDLTILIALLGKASMIDIYNNAKSCPFIKKEDLELLKKSLNSDINFYLFENLVKEYED